MIPQGYPLWVRLDDNSVHLVIGWDDDDGAVSPVLATVGTHPVEDATVVEWLTQRDATTGRTHARAVEAFLIEHNNGNAAPSTVTLVRHLRRLIATWS